jgi:hypothetical protein
MKLRTVLLLDFLATVLLTTLLGLLLAGCPAAIAGATTACKVVSVIDQACMVLTFIGSDGKPHTVTFSQRELNEWGSYVEAKHATDPK